MKDLGTINIIGGGMAGLATALALKTAGIKYNLFEQRSEITYENVGLGISANIFPILKKWNILEETKKLGTEVRDLYFVDKKLKYINSFKLERPALSVNRKLFYQLLRERLDSKNIFLNAQKSIRDFLDDEIVVAADGINSQSRHVIYPRLSLRDANQILWRGISEIKLENKFRNAYHDFVGSNLRFAIIHTGGDFYSWYAVKEKHANEKKHVDKNILKALFKDHHQIVAAVIEQSESVFISELRDIDPKERRHLSWFSGKKIMIGDAIHPSTPNMANGACLCMEDADFLENLLMNSDLPLEEVFACFQTIRMTKVDAVVSNSWRLGKLLHQQNKAMDYFVKSGIALMPRFLFDKIYSTVLEETKV